MYVEGDISNKKLGMQGLCFIRYSTRAGRLGVSKL